MALQRFDVVPLHQRATLPKAPQKAVIRNTPAPKSMASGRNCALVRPSKRKNSGMFFLLHRDQSNLIPLDPEAYIQQALELLASDRYLEKGMGLDGPDRAQACRDFLQRYLQPPSEKLPYPALLFDGQLENPSGSRHQFRSPTSSPSWPIQRNLSRPSTDSGR